MPEATLKERIAKLSEEKDAFSITANIFKQDESICIMQAVVKVGEEHYVAHAMVDVPQKLAKVFIKDKEVEKSVADNSSDYIAVAEQKAVEIALSRAGY